MKILFVCLGNICRSPLAEGIARSLSTRHEFDSAGTGSWHIGEAPCEKSQKIAHTFATPISHLRARQVTKKDFEVFDHIIAMDEKNLSDLRAMGALNAKMLLEKGVPDPYFFNGDKGMEEIYSMIKKGVMSLLEKVEKSVEE